MKIYYGKEIPRLEKLECSIVQAETATGTVLTVDGQKYFKTSNEAFILIFDSVDEAKEFAKIKIVENPKIECNIYDHSAIFVEVISK